MVAAGGRVLDGVACLADRQPLDQKYESFLLYWIVVHIVNSNSNIPMDGASIKNQLFEKIRQERGDVGWYAVDMLENAELLLGQAEQYPRQAETAAYCIRQAVVEIFRDEKDSREKLAALKALLGAIRNLDADDGQQTEQHIKNVLNAADYYKHLEVEPKYRARLMQIFRRESGIEPTPGDHSLPDAYQRLAKKLNEGPVHEVTRESAGCNAVRKLYYRSIDILTMIFLPHVRLQEIANLARIRDPQKSDARRLEEITVNAYGFDHFASGMVSQDWFDLIDPAMLKPASDGQPWPLRSLAIHLKDEHADKFAQFITENFNLFAAEDAGPAELGFAGQKLGENGLPLLVKALQKGESVRQRRTKELAESPEAKSSDPMRDEAQRRLTLIDRLENDALQAYQKADPTNPKLAELAYHLMAPHAELHKYYKIYAIPRKLIEGMDSSSAGEIVDVLIYRVRDWLKKELLYIRRLDSVADINQDSNVGMNSMVAILCKALAGARDLGQPTTELVEMLSALPGGIKHRLIAWLYSGADDVGHSEPVDFIVKGCGSRNPTGDDELLLARLERHGHLDRDAVARLCDIIREAPHPEKMRGHPLQWSLDKDESRRILWAYMLHRRIKLPDGWGPCMDILDPYLAEERESADRRLSDTRAAQERPAEPEISEDEDPHAKAMAAWYARTLGLQGCRTPSDLKQELAKAIERDAPKWAESYADTIQILHFPEYVAHYFSRLADSMEQLGAQARHLISAVRLARTRPHDAPILNSPQFPYYGDWEGVDMAGIELIKSMIKYIRLDDDALGELWDLLCDVITDGTGESSNDSQEDLINAAYRKPHTYALAVLLRLIDYAARVKKDVPERVLETLAGLVRLPGRDGEERRVFLGRWARELRAAQPSWFERHEPLLFGDGVSEELGRTALDMHISLGGWDFAVLEKYRNGVLDAVKRDVPRAMNCLLYCIFEGIKGYAPKSVAEYLMDMGPERVSEAGWQSAKLLESDANADHIRRGTLFWEAALDLNAGPTTLAGFGLWAIVRYMDQNKWEGLALRTCGLAGGKLECGSKVAERIISPQEVTEVGFQILEQLMRADLGYETHMAAKHTLAALRASKDRVGTREAWTRLRDTMIRLGYNEAAEI